MIYEKCSTIVTLVNFASFLKVFLLLMQTEFFLMQAKKWTPSQTGFQILDSGRIRVLNFFKHILSLVALQW